MQQYKRAQSPGVTYISSWTKLLLVQRGQSALWINNLCLCGYEEKNIGFLIFLSPWNVQEQWEGEWGDNISGQSCSWTVGPQTILGWTTQCLLSIVYHNDDNKVSWDDERQKQWTWLLDCRRYWVGRHRAWAWWWSQHCILERFQTEKNKHDCDKDLISHELMKLRIRKEKRKWGRQQFKMPGWWKKKIWML